MVPSDEGAKASAVTDALTHPVRGMLVSLMGAEPVTADDLAANIDLPLEKVREHLQVLLSAGVISEEPTERNDADPRPHYFRAEPVSFDEEELAELTVDQRRQIFATTLRVSFSQAARALVADPETARPDACLIRDEIELDEEAWLEFVRLHQQVWEEVKELKVRALDRLERNGDEGFWASAILMCFEQE